MSIQEHLNKIRNAIYGKEVRESIAKGIETAYDDASEYGNANMEVKIARGTHPTLRDRLNEVDKEHQKTTAQLVQTPTKDETGWANLNTFDEATRTVIQGLEPGEINAVLGIENVKSENMARDSVTEFNVYFIDKGINLFNGYIEGVSLVGGKVGESVLRTRADEGMVTVIIPVKPDTRYTINKEISDRFRVASFHSSPDLSSGLDVSVDRFIKDETDSDEAKDTSYSFITNDKEIFVAIYVSISGEKPVLSMYESQEVRFPRAITSGNIKKGKNLFDGNYVGGYLSPSSNTFIEEEYDDSAIFPIIANTTYTISKEESNRFRVGLFKTYPEFGSIADELVILDDEPELEYTFNSGDNYRYAVIQTTSRQVPPFMQVERNTMRTNWESYGYKFESEAKPVFKRYLNVEDFRVDSSESDSTVIQRAFNQARGQVVSFESGKTYEIDKTVIARAFRVRGIKGNNATLVLTGDIVGLRYTGSLNETANPEDSNNKELDITEGNAFIERLKVTSKEGHVGTGIEVQNLLSANIESCHTFNLKYGLTIKGLNRNLILSNCHIRDNFQAGLFLDAVDLHQFNMTGMHIGYSRNPIYVLDSHIYNWQMVGSDIESSQQDSYGDTESVIYIGKSSEGTSFIREVSFSGLTIQDHNSNTKPLVNIELDEDELGYFSFGTSHMSNSRKTQPLLYIKGGNRINLSNLALKNDGGIDQSFVFGNEVKNLIITGSNIEGEMVYTDVDKFIIANNITYGFNLEDTRNENVVISNNIHGRWT